MAEGARGAIMLKKHSQLFEHLFFLADLATISVCWVLAYLFRFYLGPIPVYRGIPPFRPYLYLLGAILVIWGFSFKALRLYRPRRIGTHLEEALDVAKASTISLLILLAVAYFFREVDFSRLVFVSFWFFSTAALTLWRVLFREILRFFRKRGYNLRYAVIVGTSRLAEEVIARLTAHPELGIQIVGLLAARPGGEGAAAPGELPILGGYEAIGRVVQEKGVDQVILCLPPGDADRIEGILKELANETVSVLVVPDVYQYAMLWGGIEEFEGLPFISLQDSPLYGWDLVLKRAFDFFVSLLGLLLLSPLLGVITLLVKVTSSGPVFYRQERMGLDGRLFTMLKFRTMRTDAERESGPIWAVKGDPRTTFVGSFLRRTSLDELPQLLNVLKGEMSLVGPRPERPVFIQEFRKTIPKYMLRHKIKAGITGWAQVNGWRGNTSLEKRIECDLYYIENWSLLFDLKILWLTLWTGLINRHAY